MKKLIALLLAVGTLMGAMTQANARDDRDDRDDRTRGGSGRLHDGPSIIRIEVGDDRDDRDMLRRLRRLEQAVRELQNKVYQLEEGPRLETITTCRVKFFSVGNVEAEGRSLGEAQMNTLNECKRRGGGIFCKLDEIKAENCFTSERRI